MQRIIKEGVWLYANQVDEKITIIEQDWDHYYENGYDDDEPCLNDEGLVYFLYTGDLHRNNRGNLSAKNISIPFLSSEEAEAYANAEFSNLRWSNGSFVK